MKGLFFFLCLCLFLAPTTPSTSTHPPDNLQEPQPQLALRLLQDNPNNPTGPNMGTVPGVIPNTLELLTFEVVNSISQEAGYNTSGNYQLTGPTTPNNQPPTAPAQPNISITINGSGAISNSPWTLTSVENIVNDPYWISAKHLLTKANVSYYAENQILSLSRQSGSFTNNFNLTFVSVKGFAQMVVSVSQSLIASVSSFRYLNTTVTPMDVLSPLYKTIFSLLQNLFYDFTKPPITILNATRTSLSNINLYNFGYQSSTGKYSFTVMMVGERIQVLGCDLISVSVGTQTVPVLVDNRIVDIDANFVFVNQTIQSLGPLELKGSLVYSRIVVWTNRGGNLVLYYLTVTTGGNSYDIGTTLNLTSRRTQVSSFRNNTNNTLPISTLFPSPTQVYQEVSYLSQAQNQTFLAIERASRLKQLSLATSPVSKIEVISSPRGTGYRLTFWTAKTPVVVEYTP